MKLKLLLLNILGANLVYIHSGIKAGLPPPTPTHPFQKECPVKTPDHRSAPTEKDNTCLLKTG